MTLVVREVSPPADTMLMLPVTVAVAAPGTSVSDTVGSVPPFRVTVAGVAWYWTPLA